MSSQLQSIIDTLARSTIFSALPNDTLQRIALGTSEASYKRGNAVFIRGAVATGIYVVASGQIKLIIETEQGDEHIVEIIQDGDCCGEGALMTERLYVLSAVAISDCTLLHVAGGTVNAALDHCPQLARRIIGNLSDRLYRRTGDMENILLRKALGRVARYLLDELERVGGHMNGQIQLPARKGLIASRLNMTQEHFSRTLHTLSSGGKIEVSGATIDVINETELRKIAS